MLLLLVLSLTILVGPLSTLVALVQNYNAARSTGLPLLISPVNPFNPLWILTRSYINPILASLPFGLGKFTDYDFLGFAWKDKGHLHTKYGGAYIIVTPGQNQVIVGDANACNEIFKRFREWPKNAAFNEPLNTFGPSVGTSEGDSWQRQRKVTSVAFNERNNSLVWEEAVKQARQMLYSWASKDKLGVTTTAEDNYLFALHVLTGAGFGRSYDFDSPLKVPDPGHTMSYREALRGVMGNIFVTYAIAKLGGIAKFLPGGAERVHTSMIEFKAYMHELVTKERAAYSRGEGTNAANLMSVMVRASENESRTSQEKSQGSLTDEEFVGNLFIFNVAGHDTTAGTLSYAIGLLACHTEVQNWIKRELNAVFGDEGIREDSYEAAFPRLQRCMAVMYETLRLYAPLNGIPRCTGTLHRTLSIGSQTYTIPPDTLVFVNNAAVQMDTQHWGLDALTWNPKRWLTEDDTSISPNPTTYIPWAAGPRVCPGRKFSQVEHTAAIAVLFHRHRVEPVCEPGESLAQAGERLMEVLADSDMALAMRMNKPEKMRVRWVRN